MTKHTEGPWNVEGPAMGFASLHDKDGNTIVALSFPGEQYGDKSMSDEEKAANLRLLKASPMLFGTLKEGEDIISGLEAEADDAGIDLREVRYWWQRAFALIQEVEG